MPPQVHDVYEFHVGEEVITVAVDGGQVQARQGGAESPDLVVHADPHTFVELGRGAMSPAEASESGKLSFEGDQAAAQRCAAIFAPADHPREHRGSARNADSGGRVLPACVLTT